jgi:hypothetical protein
MKPFLGSFTGNLVYSQFPERYTFEWKLENGKKYKVVTFKNIIWDQRFCFYPGDVAWFYRGKLEREKGPALIKNDGTLIFFKNNLVHCETGPAIIIPNSLVTNSIFKYFLKGKELTKNDLRKYKLNRIKEIETKELWKDFNKHFD